MCSSDLNLVSPEGRSSSFAHPQNRMRCSSSACQAIAPKRWHSSHSESRSAILHEPSTDSTEIELQNPLVHRRKCFDRSNPSGCTGPFRRPSQSTERSAGWHFPNAKQRTDRWSSSTFHWRTSCRQLNTAVSRSQHCQIGRAHV